MRLASDDIVESVIAALRANGRDPEAVTLEEAKQLTLQLLRQRRTIAIRISKLAGVRQRATCVTGT